LVEHGVNGEVQIPASPEECRRVTERMMEYVTRLLELFAEASVEITSEGELQERIKREGLKRITHR
jgi:hypothetical protein